MSWPISDTNLTAAAKQETGSLPCSLSALFTLLPLIQRAFDSTTANPLLFSPLPHHQVTVEEPAQCH